MPGARRPLPVCGSWWTRKYAYLIYYAIDETADELVVLSIKHPAQEREHQDS
jgi:hypothetical protein